MHTNIFRTQKTLPRLFLDLVCTWRSLDAPETLTETGAEFAPETLLSLPWTAVAVVRGGDPFLRADLMEILSILRKRAGLIIMIAPCTLPERILSVMSAFPEIRLRLFPDTPETGNVLEALKKLGCRHAGVYGERERRAVRMIRRHGRMVDPAGRVFRRSRGVKEACGRLVNRYAERSGQ